MSDIARQIEVLSGAAEERLRAEKYDILAERQRAEDARRDRRHLSAQMESTRASESDLLPSVAAMTDHEKRNFSLGRAVRAICAEKREHCLETELSDAIAADLKMGTAPRGGILVPLRIRASGADSKTNAAGGYLAQTRVGTSIVDALRASCRILQLGADFMSGVRFSLALPTEANVMAASWVNENPSSDAPASDSSFGQRLLRPHEMCATTSVSRQLLVQSSDNLDRFISTRIGKAHGQLLDSAAISGTGNANQPVGLLNYSGVGAVAVGANGGALTAAHMVALESTVGAANGDDGELCFLTNSTQRAKLRAVPELTGGALPLWRDGRMLGYPAFSSNQVPSTLTKGNSGAVCSAVVFGNFGAITICQFEGAVELVVDPYSLKKQAEIELTSYCSYDVAVLTPGSLAAIQDAI